MTFPTPHYEKLNAALSNDKLPKGDVQRLKDAIKKYSEWIASLDLLLKGGGNFGTIENGEVFLKKMIHRLQGYKKYIDVDLIFDSPNDFLYRQKGQLKLDNSIIEEFLPRLVYPFVPTDIVSGIELGPKSCYSSMFFTGGIIRSIPGGGMHVRKKDQDFTISRQVYIKASFNPSFANAAEQRTSLAYVAAESKYTAPH